MLPPQLQLMSIRLKPAPGIWQLLLLNIDDNGYERIVIHLRKYGSYPLIGYRWADVERLVGFISSRPRR